MERVELTAEKRDKSGSGPAKRLRKEGFVPGVLYGKDQDPINLKVGAKEISEVISGNQIIDLELEDSTQPVMVKDVQRDVVQGDLLHVDLYQISLDEEITVEVPIELAGPAVGEQEGGVLEQLRRKLEVECLPENIPSKISADVTELQVGETLSVGNIETEEDIEIVSDVSEVVATVVVPEELDLTPAAEAEEEELEEPEVIGEAEEEELEEGEELEELEEGEEPAETEEK